VLSGNPAICLPSKISLQRSLKYLYLSQQYGTFQWYLLEMTLQRILDKLTTLRDLQRLVVGPMKHWIGVLELEWIAENWPNMPILGCFPMARK